MAVPCVSLSERAGLEIVQVAAWPATAARVQARLAELLGVRPPQSANTAESGGGIVVFSTGPDRWLIVRPKSNRILASEVLDRLRPEDASVVDLGAGRRVFAIAGPRCRDVLAKFLPLDLTASRFPPGRCAQSAMGHISVLVHAPRADTFEIFVYRGFARHLWEMLTDGAREYGVEAQST